VRLTEQFLAADPAPADNSDPPWLAALAALVEDRVDLPAPDENLFAADYSPWRAVVLADDSASAVSLALPAVPQWIEPPAFELAADEPQLPAPALPVYFGASDASGSN